MANPNNNPLITKLQPYLFNTKGNRIKITENNFQDKIDEVNIYLAENFHGNISQNNEIDDTSNKSFYSFKAEFTKFVVNKIIGPLNWKIVHETTVVQASEIIVKLEIFFKVYKNEQSEEYEWFSKGPFMGNRKVWEKQQIGYTEKGAITDAISKTLALYGIGIAPYLGLLDEAIYQASQIPEGAITAKPGYLPPAPEAAKPAATPGYTNFKIMLQEKKLSAQEDMVIKKYFIGVSQEEQAANPTAPTSVDKYFGPDGELLKTSIPDPEYGLMTFWLKKNATALSAEFQQARSQ